MHLKLLQPLRICKLKFESVSIDFIIDLLKVQNEFDKYLCYCELIEKGSSIYSQLFNSNHF